MTSIPVEDIPATPTRQLSWVDAVAIVVGIVIGSGIFLMPSMVAANTGTPERLLGAWVFGGLLCLCGALTYAELATTYPHSGGEYVYLSRAYGRWLGFFFVWSRLTVIQTGSIAALAYVFGDYMNRLAPLGARGPLAYALTATVVLTITNGVGLQAGRWTQYVLSALKVLGVLGIIAVGLLADGAATPDSAAAGAGPRGAFGLAMVFVLFTFGGWNEAAYVAGEVRSRADMLKTLVVSIVLITTLYVAANFAYLRLLGMDGMAGASAIAADALSAGIGPWGGVAVSVLVAVAALGALNGCIFTGARAVWALGQDYPVFRRLAEWDQRRSTPLNALLLQSAIALVLITLPGLGPAFERQLGSGFQAAVEYTTPVFFAFLLLTGLAAFVLRWKDAGVPRGFRVPFFPLPVIGFALMSAYMLYSGLAYTRAGALVGVAVLAAGVPVYFVYGRPTSDSRTGTEGDRP